ncbi:MAG: glycogen debranching protein GlgX [Lautropia sp.]|nr:glycogen debranching protein GlgX [Lautropia sp.]
MKDKTVPLPEGHPWPMGATCQKGGINFAVFSSGALSVTLCVFDTDGHEIHRYAMNGPQNNVWHGFLPDVGPGLIYGYRVHGPYDPPRGLRYNHARLLLDPYARQLHGEFQWHESHLDRPDTQLDDNAAYMPKAVVTCADDFDWEDDRRPCIPMCDSIIYEVHVKGFTQCHPDVPAALRGTYEGMGSPAAIAHLKRLGVTAVELLPVHESISEGTLIEMGLCNYWGYNTLAFFAPDRRFARQDARREFRQMVKNLHKAGIEVILDVVYNHTPEGDQRGPTLSWRGLDNQSYYHLSRQDPAYYANYTGTGNSINASNYCALQMIMDSLRFWVQEMHVDGFRFDLASVLGRVALPGAPDPGHFDRYAPFFQTIRQDPALADVKLIAEPWDAAAGGYQLGAYLPGWSEWNDRFRDTVRRFWLQPYKDRGAFASQLAGASEQFHHDGRCPQSSINFITSHDGFTLNDLVTYNQKHNEPNGEDNRDGHNDNHSWNAGVEGPTDDPDINRIRASLRRSMLASLLLAQGTPMLTAGDEMGRTQAGNNNAYNQDNPISWVNWETADDALIEFSAHLIRLRKKHAQLRLPVWLLGAPTASGMLDVQWLDNQGKSMLTEEWNQPSEGVFAQFLGAHNEHEQDLLIIFNPDSQDQPFVMPEGEWFMVLDTNKADGRPWRANSAEAQIDKTMTQIMRTGLAINRNSMLQPPVVKSTSPKTIGEETVTVEPTGRAAQTLRPHSVYIFVARRKG